MQFRLALAFILFLLGSIDSLVVGQSKIFTPSFDCTRAFAEAEKAICTDAELAELDNQLAGAYKTALAVLHGDARKDLIAEQKRWLASRNACEWNQACLVHRHRQRIQSLNKVSDRQSQPVLVTQKDWSTCESPSAPQAITACTQIINGNIDPSSRAKAFWWRGLHHSEIKSYEKAISDFTSVIEITPNSASAFNQRGFAYFYSQKYRFAIVDFTRSLQLAPDYQFENTLHFRGRANNLVGDHRQAIADLSRVIESSPDENSYFYRAQSYFIIGKLDLARTDIVKALEISPQHEIARSLLGLIEAAEQAKKFEKKQNLLRKTEAEEKKPNHSTNTSVPGNDQEGLGTLD